MRKLYRSPAPYAKNGNAGTLLCRRKAIFENENRDPKNLEKRRKKNEEETFRHFSGIGVDYQHLT